jgi:hypothetical protein
MSDVRVGRRPPAQPAQTAKTPGLSENDLRSTGLDVAQLFGWKTTAFRRIEKVTATHVEIEGARVPRALINAKVVEGQWLRFTKEPNNRIGVSVDLKATLTGESRLSDLFQVLNRK